MSKQDKVADWTDYIGGSQMPNDELTFTDASTYGLQGYQFDTNLGAGPADGARLPEIKGLSGLPDGFVRATEEPLDMEDMTHRKDGLNLGFFLSEEEGALPPDEVIQKEAAIQNLDWLDPTQDQDPDRLPENPINIKPELEAQWTRHRVDSFSLIPNRDREIAEYEKSMREGPRSGLPGQKVAALKDALNKAVRQMHFGASIHDVKTSLISEFGDNAHVRKAVKFLEDDYGLAGKVFVRASAFPGIKNGKWVEELKKAARTARYVITNDEAVATHLGMTMVDEVPWDEAFEHYSPLLKAVGHKLASKGNLKEILRRAFLLGDIPVQVDATPKPQGHLMTTPTPVHTQVKSAEEQAHAKKLRDAHVWIARKVKEGKLSQEDALRLHEASLKPDAKVVQILKAAADLITASGEVPVYEGQGVNLSTEAQATRQQVWASLEETREISAKLAGEEYHKAQMRLVKAVKVGSLTKEEAKKIATLAKDAGQLERLMAAAIQAAPAMRKFAAEPTEVREYAGVVKEALHTTPDIPQMPGEVRQMLRWARRKMNEGMAGEKLTALLGVRFSNPLLKAGSDKLEALRNRHERLAGHLYVDAKAYASKEGFTGCDEGAKLHRTSAVKLLLAMDRCASCVYANADGVCQKYNKKLTAAITDEQRQAFLDGLTPEVEEQTPPPTYDPGEYELCNESLDGVVLDEVTQEEPLSDVTFGGMHLG